MHESNIKHSGYFGIATPGLSIFSLIQVPIHLSYLASPK